MERRGTDDVTFVAQKIDDAEIARLADSAAFVHDRTQRLRHRGPGVEKVDIDAARTIVTGGHRLCDAPIFTRPAHAPIVHGADALGPFLAQQLRKRLVAQSAPGGECIVVMMAPMVGSFGAERDSDGHLGHHRGAAAADQAAVGEQHLTAAACRLDRRIHACGAGPDHQNVGFGAHRVLGHEDLAAITIAAYPSIIGGVCAESHLFLRHIVTRQVQPISAPNFD